MRSAVSSGAQSTRITPPSAESAPYLAALVARLVQHQGDVGHRAFADHQVASLDHHARGHLGLLVHIGLEDGVDERVQRDLRAELPGLLDETGSGEVVGAGQRRQAPRHGARHVGGRLGGARAQADDRIGDDEQIVHAMAHLAHEKRLRFLRELPLGDVSRDLRRADDLAVDVLHRRHGDRDVDQFAVLALPHGVEGRDPLSAPQAGDDAVLLFISIGAHQERDALADRLFRGVAEDPLGALVPTRDHSVEGLADDRVVGDFDDEGEALRRRHGLLQLLVGHSRGLAREQGLVGRRGEFGEAGHDPQIFGVEALGVVVRNDPDSAHGLATDVERHEQRVLDRGRSAISSGPNSPSCIYTDKS